MSPSVKEHSSKQKDAYPDACPRGFLIILIVVQTHFSFPGADISLSHLYHTLLCKSPSGYSLLLNSISE